MLKAILAFTACAFIFSLISMVIPLFEGGQSKRWENLSYKQRFCESFFLPVIFFLIFAAWTYYKDVYTPSSMEEMLESGEIQYFYPGNKGFEYADAVFEIKKDNSQEEICQIIEDICKEIKMGSDSLNVYYDGERYYVIMDDKVRIGKVTTSEKRFGTLLVFTWSH